MHHSTKFKIIFDNLYMQIYTIQDGLGYAREMNNLNF